MSGIDDLRQALKIIDEIGGGDFEGNKSDDIISLAEIKLGLTFPPTYREFLKKLGCGDVEGLEFYGIITEDFENSSVPDAIWLTLDERKRGLPVNLIIFYSGGEGSYYALDSNEVDKQGEYPVVMFNQNAGPFPKVSNSFGSFLLDELRQLQ